MNLLCSNDDDDDDDGDGYDDDDYLLNFRLDFHLQSLSKILELEAFGKIQIKIEIDQKTFLSLTY